MICVYCVHNILKCHAYVGYVGAYSVVYAFIKCIYSIEE